jgi:sugar O-acyltransferase (sialic acid O-acetyltransferase NeuD family)
MEKEFGGYWIATRPATPSRNTWPPGTSYTAPAVRSSRRTHNVSTAPILLIGAGGHATACIDVIEQHGGFTVAGLTGSRAEVGTTVLGYPVLGTEEDLPALIARFAAALVVVGQIETANARMRLFARLVNLNCWMPTIVSPRAYVSVHAAVGAGTIVMHGATVNARASVGRNCIINSMALIEHNANVADHCHIATAAVLNGDVTVGAATFVGSQSSIRQGVRIGERCVIGMGQQVRTDCESGTTVPARHNHESSIIAVARPDSKNGPKPPSSQNGPISPEENEYHLPG